MQRSPTAGIHGGGPAMGSRLHGNDGRRRRTHHRHSRDGRPLHNRHSGLEPESRSREPRLDDTAWTRDVAALGELCKGLRRRESTAGGRRWVPVCTGTTEGGGAPTSSFPRTETFEQPSFRPRAGIQKSRVQVRRHRLDPRRCRAWGVMQGSPTAGIHGGGPAMGSRLHGNDGRRRRTHIVIPATGDLCTTVLPAQAGIQVWGSPLGMPAISATLSPSGGVTQRSPDAGIYPRQGAPSRLWTQSITLAVPNQVANLGSRRPVWRSTSHGASPGR